MAKTAAQPEILITAERFYSMAAGFVLALGMWFPRFGPISIIDPVIIAAAPGVIALQIARGERLPRWPLLLAMPVTISALWSYDAAATFFTGLRWLSLAFLAAYIARVGELPALAFGMLTALLLIALPSSALGLTGRTAGLSPTISLLGMVGFGAFMSAPAGNRWLKWSIVTCGMLCIAASATRSPALAAATGGLARGWWWVAPAVALTGTFVLFAFLQGGAGRIFSVETIETDIELRSATGRINIAGEDYDRMVGHLRKQGIADGADGLILFGEESSIWGLGANAYAAANGWPRPHNVPQLAWEEQGVFLIGPVAVFAWALWRRKLPIAALMGMAVYGILDDSLINQLGHYAIASVLLVHVMEARRCRSEA